VSKEYATLLAQVIPVLALALGLEIRAIVGRMKQSVDAGEPIRPFRSGALLGALGVILAFLGGIEIQALSIVAGSGFWSDLTVPLATGFVFLAPMPGAVYVGMRTEGSSPRRAGTIAAGWTAVLVVLMGSQLIWF